MNTSPHQAISSGKAQPSGWSYVVSPIKESVICTGIWAILVVLFTYGLKLWGDYAHPGQSITTLELATYAGRILGQFILMTLCLWAVLVYRIWKNVTPFILLDWRWWLGLVLLSAVLSNPPLAWVWVGLIYQMKSKMKSSKRKPRMRPKIPSSTTVNA